MLEGVTIFHRGGFVLWQWVREELRADVVNSLIDNVLLEEKGSTTSYTHGDYMLKWTLKNELDLVFVVVYLKQLTILYANELLSSVKNKFCKMFKGEIPLLLPSYKFDESFDKILWSYESTPSKKAPVKSDRKASGSNRLTKAQKKAEKRRKAQERDEGSGKKPQQKASSSDPAGHLDSQAAAEEEGGEQQDATGDEGNDGAGGDEDDEEARARRRRENIAKLKMRSSGRKGRGGMSRKGGQSQKKADKSATPKTKSKGKVMRTWDNSKATKEELEAMDYSKEVSGEELAAAQRRRDEEFKAKMGDLPDDDGYVDMLSDSDDEEESSESKGAFGRIWSRFVGKKLDREQLSPVMETFKENLMGKNVAQSIAEQLCESVVSDLEGKECGALTSVKSKVSEAIGKSLTRILTPRKPVDVVQGVLAAKKQKRPYTMCFVGVNGVGKSTTLSKVAAYLMSLKFTVGIAACDTFRSGAIEQLRTHCKRLDVPLYAQGYDRDAAFVASEAIKRAKAEGRDAVLIDTAGRMQDNQPLMRALAKLIAVNRPDLVLFVGEALVGNDAVDQLTKFHQQLQGLQSTGIDGIILTKFDVIDDKVGAAISMTYSTGKPIVFVGTGQTYKDLKRLNVATIVKSLLK